VTKADFAAFLVLTGESVWEEAIHRVWDCCSDGWKPPQASEQGG
jgi:hypothetical protein